MELPIHDIAERLDEAASAAERGERVFVTRDGHAVVELVPVRKVPGMDFEKAKLVRQAMGIDGLTVEFGPEFDDPAYSRRVLGLED